MAVSETIQTRLALNLIALLNGQSVTIQYFPMAPRYKRTDVDSSHMRDATLLGLGRRINVPPVRERSSARNQR